MESAKIIGKLARMLRQVGPAEELAQDAFVAALEQWPKSGLPDNPAAWLMTTAKNKAIDALRHRKLMAIKHGAILHEAPLLGDGVRPTEEAAENDLDDDMLSLIFTACHPVLSTQARIALTLRLLGGLTVGEIARAFLVPEATISQRIVRAKRTLAEARVPFEVPPPAERDERLSSVLSVIYLIFNEGYAATSGGDWMRPALCDEALRLGRILAELMRDESEVHGLAALMEIQASRMRARINATGEPVLLGDQNRSHWDQLLIHRGLAALDRAQASGNTLGPYALQAAIAACHARARRTEDTDWTRIVALYDALAQTAPSPVVELNRAVAVSMAFGPAAALEVVNALMSDARLKDYHLLPSVRGDLLQKLGRYSEAREEFMHAAALAGNSREKTLLLGRASACGVGSQ